MQNLKGPLFKQLRPSKSGNPSKLPNFSSTTMLEEQAVISIFHNCSPKSFDGLSSSSLAHIPQLDILPSSVLAADARECPPSLFPSIPMQSRFSAHALSAWRPSLTCWKERSFPTPLAPLASPCELRGHKAHGDVVSSFLQLPPLSLFSGTFSKVNHGLALENQRCVNRAHPSLAALQTAALQTVSFSLTHKK